MGQDTSSSTDSTVCSVCNHPGHEAGTECLDCCGHCGTKKDASGSCPNKCLVTDFWSSPALSNGVPATWREENATV